jgi:23S rRNA pseudouridine2604 synthase
MNPHRPDADTDAVRLSKRVAALRSCSRTEAERLIVAGAVQVDGVVVDQPQARVAAHQQVHIKDGTAPLHHDPSTVLWYKPAGVALPQDAKLTVAWLNAQLPSRQRVASMAFPGAATAAVFHTLGPKWQTVAPLLAAEAGVQLLSQHNAVLRHWSEGQAVLEQEWLLDVPSALDDDARQTALRSLQSPLSHDGRSLASARVSWQSDTRIRLAIKGALPGQLGFLVQRAGLSVSSLRRQRLGRLSISGLEPGQWRLLMPTERI